MHWISQTRPGPATATTSQSPQQPHTRSKSNRFKYFCQNQNLSCSIIWTFQPSQIAQTQQPKSYLFHYKRQCSILINMRQCHSVCMKTSQKWLTVAIFLKWHSWMIMDYHRLSMMIYFSQRGNAIMEQLIEFVSYRQSSTDSYLLVWNTVFYNGTGSSQVAELVLFSLAEKSRQWNSLEGRILFHTPIVQYKDNLSIPKFHCSFLCVKTRIQKFQFI